MHTIGSTGPGLLTRTVYDSLTTPNESNTTSELMQSVLILPYFAFTPVPNTVTVDIADVEARTVLKEQYVIHPFVDRLKCTNDSVSVSTTTDSNGSTIESNTTCSNKTVPMSDMPVGSRTYAIHWWQRSWQKPS